MPAILTSKELFDIYHNTSTLSNILKATTPLECLSLSSEAEVKARYKEFQRLDAIHIQSGKTNLEDRRNIEQSGLLKHELEPNWFSYHRIWDNCIHSNDAFLLDFILLGKDNMLCPQLEPTYGYNPNRVPWTAEQVEQDKKRLLWMEEDIKHSTLSYGRPLYTLKQRNEQILAQNEMRWKRLMRPLSPPPADTFRFDYNTEGTTTRVLANADSIFLNRARSAVKAIISDATFDEEIVSDFQPLQPEDLRISCNIQQLLDPIPFWWLHCVENATWWSKPRNNILAKETMYQHFLSYCDPYNWTSEQDRVMDSDQLFWEAFYQVQPIKDKLMRRIKRLSDGSKKRTVHVRLPNLLECQNRLVKLLRGKGLYCIFMEQSAIPAIPVLSNSEGGSSS
jgi:hypothetical protein